MGGLRLHSRQPKGAKVKHKHCLLAVVVALSAATAVRAQYVEDSIDVGGHFVTSLAYNSREDVLYGAAYYGGFFAISCDSNKVVRSFALSYPREVVYDSVDNEAWCTYWGSDLESLAVIDGATHTLKKKMQMPGATKPVWDPVSGRLYVSCATTNSVTVLDCDTDSVLTHISVGAYPESMYVNTLRRKLYVMNWDDATVSVINMLTNQVVSTISVRGEHGYYSRSVDKFYFGAEEQCVVIDGQSNAVVARISLPNGANYVESTTGNESAGLVYLAASGSDGGHVITISAHGDSVLASVPVGDMPRGLAYCAGNDRLYGLTCSPDSLVVLPGDGARVLKKLPMGGYPCVTSLVPRHKRVYVGHSNTRYVYVVRDSSLAVAEPQSPRSDFHGTRATPSPFSHGVAVIWDSPLKGDEAARVYAQDGRLARQARIPAGEARWVWDGRDDSGTPLPPGVYVIEAGPGLRAKVVKTR